MRSDGEDSLYNVAQALCPEQLFRLTRAYGAGRHVPFPKGVFRGVAGDRYARPEAPRWTGENVYGAPAGPQHSLDLLQHRIKVQDVL
jgi:hypothetical protein